MAIKTWTINVAFTANQAGEHRLCWRVLGDPSYDCSTLVSCVGGGASCTATIQSNVNNTSCDGPVTIEGYIQPTCEDELSVSNRLYWSTTFTPNVICERYEVSCLKGPLSTVELVNKGSNYSMSDTITIVRDIDDPEVTDGALSIVSLGTGVINSITYLTTGGTGYTAGDVLTIVGSAGSGGTITIDTVGGPGTIASYTLTTGGSGYIGPFTFTGGTGTGANFLLRNGIDYDDSGSILSISVVNQGLYSKKPTLTVSGGTGAILDVKLSPCTGYNAGTDCDGNNVTIAALRVGDTCGVCLVGGISAPTGHFSEIRSGCCIPGDSSSPVCFTYSVTNDMGSSLTTINYMKCNGQIDSFALPAGSTISVCAVEDGIIHPDLYKVSIAKGTFCS